MKQARRTTNSEPCSSLEHAFDSSPMSAAMPAEVRHGTTDASVAKCIGHRNDASGSFGGTATESTYASTRVFATTLRL